MSECQHLQKIPETTGDSGRIIWWKCANCGALFPGA